MMLIIHKYKCTPFEQQSDVPNSDFIERRVCSQMGLSTQTHTCTYVHARTHQNTATNTQPQTHTHPSWKVTPGCFDCFWLLSSPLNLLSASQPHTQHFSYDFTYRLGKITPWYTMSAQSGVPSSWFGHRRLEDMSVKRVWAVLIKWYKHLLIGRCCSG